MEGLCWHGGELVMLPGALFCCPSYFFTQQVDEGGRREGGGTAWNMTHHHGRFTMA